MKKIMLLVTAAAAVAAFAVPASASASGMFYHEGKPFEGSTEVKFTGWLAFDTAVGGMRCDVHPVAHINTNGGTITTFGITTETCVGSGLLEPCTLENDALDETPTLTPTATTIDILNVDLTNTYGGEECPLEGSRITFGRGAAGPAVGTPNNPNAISTLTISGTGKVHTALGELNALATGELEVTNKPGTYSIG